MTTLTTAAIRISPISLVRLLSPAPGSPTASSRHALTRPLYAPSAPPARAGRRGAPPSGGCCSKKRARVVVRSSLHLTARQTPSSEPEALEDVWSIDNVGAAADAVLRTFRIYEQNRGITAIAELWHEQCIPQPALTASFPLHILKGSLNLKNLDLAYSRLHHRGLVDQRQAGPRGAGVGGGEGLAQGGQRAGAPGVCSHAPPRRSRRPWGGCRCGDDVTWPHRASSGAGCFVIHW